MKKPILLYGIVSGLLMVLFLLLAFGNFDKAKEFDPSAGQIFGFSVQFLVITGCMILALRAARKNGIAATFGKDIQITLAIAGLTSVLYVIGWAVIYNTLASSFPEVMDACNQKLFEQGKLSQKDLDMSRDLMKNYNKPLYFIGFTLIEILPTGIILSLLVSGISALVRRIKRK